MYILLKLLNISWHFCCTVVDCVTICSTQLYVTFLLCWCRTGTQSVVCCHFFLIRLTVMAFVATFCWFMQVFICLIKCSWGFILLCLGKAENAFDPFVLVQVSVVESELFKGGYNVSYTTCELAAGLYILFLLVCLMGFLFSFLCLFGLFSFQYCLPFFITLLTFLTYTLLRFSLFG